MKVIFQKKMKYKGNKYSPNEAFDIDKRDLDLVHQHGGHMFEEVITKQEKTDK